MGRLSGVACVAAIGGLLVGIQAVSIEAKAKSAPDRIAADPDERICEDIKVIGSRLAVRRVCATRAEWKERRKLDREVVDDAQRHAADPCNSVLTYSGPAMC